MTGRLALFADCLLVGVLTALAAIGVVTAFPALATACAVLRERVAQERSVGVRRYAGVLLDALRSGVGGLVVPLLVVAVLLVDGVALTAGVPGAGPLAVLLVVASSAAIVVGLRTAAAWRPGVRWGAAAGVAVRSAPRDPGGSALLWLAGLSALAIVIAVPISMLLVGGPLAMAAVAVDARVADRARVFGGEPSGRESSASTDK